MYMHKVIMPSQDKFFESKRSRELRKICGCPLDLNLTHAIGHHVMFTSGHRVEEASHNKNRQERIFMRGRLRPIREGQNLSSANERAAEQEG